MPNGSLKSARNVARKIAPAHCLKFENTANGARRGLGANEDHWSSFFARATLLLVEVAEGALHRLAL
jgi:hypothetical protein